MKKRNLLMSMAVAGALSLTVAPGLAVAFGLRKLGFLQLAHRRHIVRLFPGDFRLLTRLGLGRLGDGAIHRVPGLG